MPAIDVNRNASRRAVRRVNHQRARVVRQNARQVVTNIRRPPAPLPGTDQARTGARAGVRPKPARRTPPRRTRPSFVGPTPEQAVRHQISVAVRPGGNLRRRERAQDFLRDTGLLPGLGPQERRAAELRARQRAQQRQQEHHGGGFATLVSHVPGIGGTLADAVMHAPLLGRIGADLATFGTAEIPGFNPMREIGKAVGRGVQETLDIAAETPPAVYHLGDLAVHGHAGEVVKALAQPYIDVAKHPLRSLRDQPVHTALLLAGGEGAVARGLGRVGREAERPPLMVPGTSIAERRRVSRDVVVRRAQRRRDAQALAKAQDLYRRADRESDPVVAENLRRQATKTDPRVMSGKQIGRRVNERISANEGIRRRAVQETLRDVKKRIGKRPSPIIRLIAENVVKPTREDLTAYARELQAQEGRLRPDQRRSNRLVRREIQKALDSNVDLGELARTARAYAETSVGMQRRLRNTGLIGEEADIARHVPFAARHMGVRYDRDVGAYVDRQGRQVSLEDIRREMGSRGFGEPAFITQAPGRAGRGNFYTRPEERRLVGGARRTGEATGAGTFDIRPEALTETPAHVESLIQADRGFKAFVGEFGFRAKSGRLRAFQNYRQASAAARDLNATTGLDWRPVRIHPFHGNQRPLRELLEQTRSDEHPQVLQERIAQAVSGEDGPGPWALVPDAAARRLGEHARVLGASAGGRAYQALNQAFRRTVLSLSPSWATGNIVEAGVRAVINRAGPLDLVHANRVLKRLEELSPEAAKEMHERVGAGHFAFAGKRIHRDPSQFATAESSPAWQKATRALEILRHAPPGRWAVGLWDLWTSAVFGGMGKLEGLPRKAMFGQALKRDGLKAIDQAAQGLTNTNEQVRFARAVDRAYGQYDKFGPHQRQAIALYTPFAAWFLNAVKFVGQVLPQDHPVVTSLLASANQATEEWRKNKGLSMFMQGGLPGFLQGSIPVKGGHKIFRYTPFAAFNDPLENTAGLVLPQFNNVLMAFRGKDWKGDDLPKGTDRGSYALEQFLASVVPVVHVADQLYRAKGKTLGQKAARTYNPFRTTPENTHGKSSSGGDDPVHQRIRDLMGPGNAASQEELYKAVRDAVGASR